MRWLSLSISRLAITHAVFVTRSPAPGSAAARSRSPSPSRSSTGTPPPVCTTVKTKLQLVDLAGSECVGRFYHWTFFIGMNLRNFSIVRGDFCIWSA